MVSPSLTRRRFLATSGALITSLSTMPHLAFARTGMPARLVVVVLRGALDGLAAVPPHADPAYASLHRDLAIAAPGAADGALDLDATFGLHPALGFLHERYAAKELIVFQAIASPYRERSHFDGQNVLENGLTQPSGSADGWLNRTLAALPAADAAVERALNRALAAPPSGHLASSPAERAVAIAQNVPLILRGAEPVLSKSPLRTPDVDGELLARLEDLYSKDDWFSARLSEAVQSEHLASLLSSDGQDGPVMAGAATPATVGKPLSAAARLAAGIMRSPQGPELAVLEAGGWDTHANQGGAKGVLAQRLGGLDEALRVLAAELGDLWAQTAVLVATEFGRTAAMNGTRGTDHGTGGCAFLAGGAVQGGRVIADWPGLTPGALLEARDLRPTLDLRSVFKGVLGDHLQVDRRTLETKVFPNSGAARPLPGLMRA